MELSKRLFARVSVMASVLVLTASACGSIPETSERVVATSTTSTMVTPTSSPTEADPTEAGVTGAAPSVMAAFAALGEAHSFRVTGTNGQIVKISALGIDQVQEMDPSRPMTIVEVAANGDSYTFLDLGPLFAPLVASVPEVAAAIDETHLEIWATRSQMVIDATGYQSVADLDPTQDLGPFTPGVGVIDLERLEGLGEADLAEALTGTGIVDPAQMAEQLPAMLEGLVPSAKDPHTYAARATYGDVIEAMGGDVEQLSRAAAIGIAPAMGVSVDDVAGFYQHYYDSVPTEVLITIGDDAAVSSVRMTTDLSGVYEAVLAEGSGLGLDASDAELAQARKLFEGTIWIIETLTVFELDDSITVTPPEGDFEDRTELAATFFAQLIPD